jgi:3-hydroxyisobutyrate dehydrogenase
MRLAICGLGNMGRALADRALDQGHELTVWNRSKGKVGDLVDRGAHEAASPAEAATDAEVVFVVVTDDAAARAVCLGEGDDVAEPVVAGLSDAAVLADVTTVSPATARRLAKRGPADRVLDTPVLGSPAAIAEGKGRFLVGGPTASYELIQPLLADLSTDTVHCGPAGHGATMKLASNLLLIAGVAALAEAVEIARSQGVDVEHLTRALHGSAVVSQAMAMRLPALLDAQHPGWFGPALARKDVRLATELAADAGIDARLSRATLELLDTVTGADWPDFAAVIEGLRA